MQLHKIRPYIENNFLALVIISSLSGLFIPNFDFIPKDLIPWLMATIVLFSCALVNKNEITHFKPAEMLLFYVLRFLLIPFLCYFLFSYIYPELKTPVLLLMLMPAGVMVPAIAAMMGGNISLGISGVIISSFFTPIVLPIAFTFIGIEGIEINTISLFISLFIMILLPIIVYFAIFDRFDRAKKIMKTNARAYSIITICLISSSIIAQQKNSLFSDPIELIVGILSATLLFIFMYGFGYMFAYKKNKEERICYAVLSGTNNIALALALSIVFFPPEFGRFILIGVIIWIAALPIFKKFLATQLNKNN